MSFEKRFKLESGNCIHVLKSYPDNYFHSIVTDPPYNVNIANGSKQKGWDSFKSNRHFQKWCEQWAQECIRVLKPGGFIISFSSQRTCHRMTCALEDAGFEIKDVINWIYFSGMPKGTRSKDKNMGPTLKPCTEPAVLAKKPLSENNNENQYKKTKTGFLHIEVCRFPFGSTHWLGPNDDSMLKQWEKPIFSNITSSGRYLGANKDDDYTAIDLSSYKPDNGRYPANIFHCKKANIREKDAGIKKSSQNQNKRRNFHPSVKPLKLMRWLIKLVTPKNGKVLDPFLGSGTTAVACMLDGYKCVGIELNKDYHSIINSRVKYAYENSNNQDFTEED